MKITKSQLRQIIKEELNKELAEASEAEAQLRKRYKEISAKLDAGEELIIQYLEEEPIAVTTGLTVLETNPVESQLDIYSSTQ